MTRPTCRRYHERELPFTGDPLAAVAHLARSGPYADHVVYENDGSWSYAGGAVAEVTLDRSGTTVRRPGAPAATLAWDGRPLRQVQDALDRLPVDGWRAYGWAAFELTYAKDGDAGAVGDECLLHLVVPETEVRLAGGVARVRSTDPAALDRVAGLLAGAVPDPVRPARPLDVRRAGAEDYQRAVATAVSDINAGKLQKVILSRAVRLERDVDLVATYVLGRRATNPARSFLLSLGGVDAAGFSPEIVVRVERDGRVVSQPLAGTRALTAEPARNLELRADLSSDPKEVFEHAISVKVACEDLLAVCAPGSVAVEEFMVVRERGSVQHLASRVAGRLAPGRDRWDAFGAAFPAVTASGVPRTAACAAIQANEPAARGLYAGSVLVVDQDGVLDAALVLRSIYRRDGVTWLQAGAGIVGQSVPVREYEETCEKLDSVARFLVPEQLAAAGTGGVA